MLLTHALLFHFFSVFSFFLSFVAIFVDKIYITNNIIYLDDCPLDERI